ncbi:MFS transporter [Mesobacillus selenatarsenatis]|uniref:MFS transporter n=1 Tax=Mesobacillus selenatarsenatis TaxID=388741 RepID=A0A846TIX7_9BACI|nr:MFS transporter [Mesobacillus selenatarsenatis]NKE06910.1 MFS transporter [Mesobacillus selenatarsenatis]
MNTSRLWTAQFTAIVIMAFLFFLCLQLLTAGFPAFITDIKNNPAQGGLMTTVFMVSAIAIRPFVPSLMQKMDNKKLSVISLGFIAISVALSFGQDSVALLLLLRIFHGIGFGIITTIFSTMATNIIPAHRLGEGIGYYGMATSVGTSLGPMLALALLQVFSFNLLIVLSVGLTLLTLLLNLFIKGPRKPAKMSTIQKGYFREHAFDRHAFTPAILTAFFSITLGGVVSFLRELGKEAGLGATISLFFLVLTIVMVIIRPFSGRIYDRFGHKFIIYPAVVSGIIGLTLLAITQNTMTLLVAAVFYGLAYGTVAPTLQALAVGAVQKEKQGTANAMYFSSMDLGMALGSAGLGLLASYTSYHFIYGFSVIFLVGLMLAYTFVFVLKKKPQERFMKKSIEA